MKQSAKDAGVETNIRVVEATATNLLPKYNSTNLATFDQAMVDKLNGNVKNPFTQSEVVELGAVPATGATLEVAARGYNTHVSTSTGTPVGGTAEKVKKGTVCWVAYVSGSAIQCDVWGYDGSGFRSEIHQVN